MIRKHSAGKGDRYRRVDFEKYSRGWDAAFGPKETTMTTFSQFRTQVECTWRGVPHSVDPLLFLSNAINEEAGEFAGQVKRVFRDDGGVVLSDRRTALLKELGDMLYYIDRAAEVLGGDLDTVVALLEAKLADRLSREVIQGDGDNR